MSIDDLIDVSSPSTTTSSTLQHSNSLCDLDLDLLDDDEWLFSPMKLTQTQKSIRPLTWLTQTEDSSDDEDDSDPTNSPVHLRKKKTHNLSPHIPYTEISAGDFAPWRRRGSVQSLASSTHSTISTSSSSVLHTMIDFSKEMREHIAAESKGHLYGKMDPAEKVLFDIQSAIHFYNNLSMQNDGKHNGIRDDCETRPVEPQTATLDQHSANNPSVSPIIQSPTLEHRSPVISRPCSASSTTSASSSHTQVSATDPPKKTLSPRPRSSLPKPNSLSSTTKIPPSSNHSSPTITPREISTPRAGKLAHPQKDNNSKIRSPVAPHPKPNSLLGRYATLPSFPTAPSPKTPILSKLKTYQSSPNLNSSSKVVSERKPITSSRIDRSKPPDPLPPRTSDPIVRRLSLQRPVDTDNSKLPVPRRNSGKSGLPRPASYAGLRNFH